MATTTEQLRVEIRLRDFVVNQLKRTAGAIRRFAVTAANRFRALGRAVLSLRGLLVGLGAGLLAKSFIEAGSAMEKFRVQLNAVLGQNKALAEQTLKWVRDFAAATPFTTKAVIESFVTMKAAGIDATKEMLSTIGDVAFVFDQNINDLSIALVGMEKEVFKRLGVGWDIVGDKATITLGNMRLETAKTREAMRKGILELWTKQFPGAMKEAEKTWSGLVALMQSQWFEFQADVMDAGVFDFIKEGLRVASQEFKVMSANPKEAADAIIDAMEFVVKALAAVADGIQVLKITFVVLGIAVNGVMVVISGAITGMLKKVEDVLKSVSNSISVIQSFGATFLATAFGRGFADALGTAKEKVDALTKGVKSFGDAGVKVMKGYLDSVKLSVEEVKRLTEASKLEDVERIFVKLKAALKVRDDLKLLREEYERLFRAQEKALETLRFKEFLALQDQIVVVQERFAKFGERGAAALTLAEQKAKLIQQEMDGAAKATRKTDQAASRLAKTLAMGAANAVKQAVALAEATTAFDRMQDEARIKEANDRLAKQRERYNEIKSAAIAVGDVIGDNILKGIDAGLEGTFRWKKALQDVAQDLGRLLLRQAITAAIQFAAGALAGAATSGSVGTGINQRPATGRGGVVLGGLGLPSAQTGMVVRGPTALLAGDDRSGVGEGVLPLRKTRGGELGVQSTGDQGPSMVVNINVSAIDAKGTDEWLHANRAKIGDMMGVNQVEGHRSRSSF